jgi:hypothetical protein
MNQVNSRRWLANVVSALIAGKYIPADANVDPDPQTVKPGLPPPTSQIQVVENREGSVLIRTSAAEFHLLQSGYIRAFLASGGERRSLDDADSVPSLTEPEVMIGGKAIRGSEFVPDRVNIVEARG